MVRFDRFTPSRLLHLVLLLACVVLQGCATVFPDPQYTGGPAQKILVCTNIDDQRIKAELGKLKHTVTYSTLEMSAECRRAGAAVEAAGTVCVGSMKICARHTPAYHDGKTVALPDSPHHCVVYLGKLSRLVTPTPSDPDAQEAPPASQPASQPTSQPAASASDTGGPVVDEGLTGALYVLNPRKGRITAALKLEDAPSVDIRAAIQDACVEN